MSESPPSCSAWPCWGAEAASERASDAIHSARISGVNCRIVRRSVSEEGLGAPQRNFARIRERQSDLRRGAVSRLVGPLCVRHQGRAALGPVSDGVARVYMDSAVVAYFFW